MFFGCFIFVLSFLAPLLMHCSRLMRNNKDLLTYLLTYLLVHLKLATDRFRCDSAWRKKCSVDGWDKVGLVFTLFVRQNKHMLHRKHWHGRQRNANRVRMSSPVVDVDRNILWSSVLLADQHAMTFAICWQFSHDSVSAVCVVQFLSTDVNR